MDQMKRDEAIDILCRVAASVVSGEPVPFESSEIIAAIEVVRETDL